jgi:hypothetical protein
LTQVKAHKLKPGLVVGLHAFIGLSRQQQVLPSERAQTIS